MYMHRNGAKNHRCNKKAHLTLNKFAHIFARIHIKNACGIHRLKVLIGKTAQKKYANENEQHAQLFQLTHVLNGALAVLFDEKWNLN